MASRPRHEALRGLVTELLREGFGAAFSELEHERYLVDNSGRIDVAWGATVIELKTDLRREERDVVARMPDYLADASRGSAPGRTTVGLATDGATLLAYTLDRGALAPIGRYEVEVEHPERLLSWLEPLLSPVPEVMPTPIAVALAFGRYSLAFGRAHAALQRLWSEVGNHSPMTLTLDITPRYHKTLSCFQSSLSCEGARYERTAGACKATMAQVHASFAPLAYAGTDDWRLGPS